MGNQGKILLHEEPRYDIEPPHLWVRLNTHIIVLKQLNVFNDCLYGECRVLVQFWCSYGTVPLNVIVTQVRLKPFILSRSFTKHCSLNFAGFI